MLKSRIFSRSLSTNIGAKIKSSSALNKPQYDYKYICANADQLVESAKLRRMSPEGVELVRDNYQHYIKAKQELSDLQASRKKLETFLQPNKSTSIAQEEVTRLRTELSQLKLRAKDLTARVLECESTLLTAGDSVPNTISPDSFLPEPLEIEFLNDNGGARPVLENGTDHMTIASKLGLVDLEQAARISGSSWYYLIGDGALLEQALVNYALSKARKRGFVPVIPPSIVRQEIVNACGFKPRDQNGEQQIYNVEGTDLCLTGTAEIPLAGLYSESIIKFNSEGVRKHVGVSRSYRAEAGARGRDTKGLYRVHEFTKVELFAWTSDYNKSVTTLEDILDLQKEIISELGLTARVLKMSPDELGAPAHKKYDIEAWMPGRQDWGEVTSSSNCLDFQSRRLHTKFRDENAKLAFAHTLNGTAIAVPRVIVAILETFYEPKTSRVKIPAVLRKYMDDKEYME